MAERSAAAQTRRVLRPTAAAARAGARDPVRVIVSRGGLEESAHEVHAVICDAAGTAFAVHGDAEVPVIARSAIKPIQAAVAWDAGAFHAFGFGLEEVALACASHGGEPEHVAVARRALALCGAGEEDLACGPHEPLHAPAARALAAAGERPGRVHNNCSGKHAAMIALARHLGAPVRGYHAAEHPVQRAMGAALAAWAGLGLAGLQTATDGCGVVTFRLPLRALAVAYARWGVADAGPRAVREAIAAHPRLLAGTGRLCTAVTRVTEGAVLAKVGAEGVYCACVPARGLGIALKALDGSRRAADAALAALLDASAAVSDAAVAELQELACPPVRNTRGDVVGAIEAVAGDGRARS